MSVQPKRRTASQKRRRASHFALTKIKLAQCQNCGQSVLWHRLCPHCGHYKKGPASSAGKQK